MSNPKHADDCPCEGCPAYKQMMKEEEAKAAEAEFIRQYDNCYGYDNEGNALGGQYGNDPDTPPVGKDGTA